MPGPTAYFGLMNCVARHDIKEADLGTVSEAYPHLIFEARWATVSLAPPQSCSVQEIVVFTRLRCVFSPCRASPRHWASE